MNKKLMAIAVAGALAAPAVALAQASNVTIYGRANLGIDSVSATGATAANSDFKTRTRVWDQGSRLGVRGEESLGGGMKAVFTIETGVNIDNGSTTGANGSANASTGTLASRDSFAGIEGSMGRVTFGRQSVFWTNANDLTQAAYINVGLQYATGTIGRLGSPSARTNNVMQYQSPVWSGFSANLSYAPQSENAAANIAADGKLWGLTLLYRGASPLTAQLDWARKQTPAATSAGDPRNNITGTKLGLGWAYVPDANLSIVILRFQNENNAAVAGFNGATDNLKQNGWQLNWTHMFGNVQGMAQYGRMGDVSGCAAGNDCGASGTKGFLLSAKYHLSKRTGVYVSYTEIKNERNQTADYSGGNMGVAPAGALPAGADPKIFAVGMLHNF